MRQPQHKNRMRARNRRQPNPVNRIYESNGPDVKIRGTAQHVAEKYMQLGRDALSSGDEIKAESYFQHAEHYYRIIAAAQEQIQQRRQQQQEQREQRMRGNGRSRSTPQPMAAVPAPEAAPALPAPGNDSSGDGDGVSRASESVEETPLQPEAADAAQTVTVIDVSGESGEKTAAAGNGQDVAGDGMATLEPDMQVVAFTDIGTNDETEDTATAGNGRDGEGAVLETAEDWGGSPPGFLMQPVTAADTAAEDKSEANGGNGAALTESRPADANDGNVETSDATTETADADAAVADTEDKPRRTRRTRTTRTTRTTRRTRRTTRKSTASGDAADSGGASAGEA